MTRIDIHHHLVEEVGYIDQLLGAMDEFEIERCSLIGMGPICHGLFVRGQHDGSTADNDAVATIVKQHPDRFFGLGFIRLGVDAATRVDELRDRGFAALKFHVSRNRYDAEENFPVFEKAQAHGLPCLFHTGIINLPEPMPGERISSFNMDAIH
ncbi:MAG: amidohydrolase family protein, partial [Lentisphaeria bacterium]|nr:amidohydrolase family protein [Lentisphaeria bacterium]